MSSKSKNDPFIAFFADNWKNILIAVVVFGVVCGILYYLYSWRKERRSLRNNPQSSDVPTDDVVVGNHVNGEQTDFAANDVVVGNHVTAEQTDFAELLSAESIEERIERLTRQTSHQDESNKQNLEFMINNFSAFPENLQVKLLIKLSKIDPSQIYKVLEKNLPSFLGGAINDKIRRSKPGNNGGRKRKQRKTKSTKRRPRKKSKKHHSRK